MLSAHLSELPEDTPVEIWFQDEARIGQKNGIVRQWSRRGSRPRQPADQRYENAYLFGAICPARGTVLTQRYLHKSSCLSECIGWCFHSEGLVWPSVVIKVDPISYGS